MKDLAKNIVHRIYLEGKKRDEVAEQFEISTKVLRLLEREYLKKVLAKHFKVDLNKNNA